MDMEMNQSLLGKSKLEKHTHTHTYICVKNLPADAWDAGDTGSIPGLGRCPGEGNGNPL